MNVVVIIGNLSRDVVLHENGQTQFCHLNVAVNDRKKNPVSGEWEDRPSFIPVKVFGKQAVNCDRYLKKGSKVAVNGRIETGSYTKEDGTKVYTTDVIAQNVEFMPRSDNSQGEQTKMGDTPSDSEPSENLPEGFHEVVDEDIPF